MAGRSEDATDRRRRSSSSEPCAHSDQDVPRALEPIWAERDGDLCDQGKNRIGCRADSVGHPLPNVSIYLLDADFQPVQQGEEGEIYIGGAGVGLGYLNRPDLNRACFLPDPLADGAHTRIYKSGDRAVQLEDGSFDFLGRVDHQVKIRGFRIELGEIEAVLRECDGVQAAVVRAIDWRPATGDWSPLWLPTGRSERANGRSC